MTTRALDIHDAIVSRLATVSFTTTGGATLTSEASLEDTWQDPDRAGYSTYTHTLFVRADSPGGAHAPVSLIYPTLFLEIRGVVKDCKDWKKDADRFGEAIQAALAQDVTWSGKAIDTLVVSYELGQLSAERSIGGCLLKVEVQYEIPFGQAGG